MDGALKLVVAVVFFVIVTGLLTMVIVDARKNLAPQPEPNVKCFITEGHPQTIECRCG